MVALRGNRGPDCVTCSPLKIDVVLYPGSHRVGAYLYCTGVFLVEVSGHSPRPPISLYCTGVILVETCGHSSPSHFLVLYRYYSRRVGIASPPPFPCTAPVFFPVEERGHSPYPPPPPIFCWGPRLRLGLCAFSARGRLSRGICHFSTFDGGVF